MRIVSGLEVRLVSGLEVRLVSGLEVRLDAATLLYPVYLEWA